MSVSRIYPTYWFINGVSPFSVTPNSNETPRYTHRKAFCFPISCYPTTAIVYIQLNTGVKTQVWVLMADDRDISDYNFFRFILKCLYEKREHCDSPFNTKVKAFTLNLNKTAFKTFPFIRHCWRPSTLYFNKDRANERNYHVLWQCRWVKKWFLGVRGKMDAAQW